MKYFKIIFVLFFFASCFPQEDPIDPFARGGAAQVSLSMGSDKNDIVFYDLENNREVARTRPIAWDIHFNNQILEINYFRQMRVAIISDNWAQTTDTQDLDFSYLQYLQSPMWELESNQTYVLDLGSDEGTHLGFIKFKYSRSNENVIIEYGDLSSSAPISRALQETETYFSLLEDEKVILPGLEDYDIAFGKYKNYFEVEQLDYTVLGTITSNSLALTLAQDFEELGTDDLALVTPNPMQRDAIGYAWKSYDFDLGSYVIDPLRTSVIWTRNGFQYKLRFTNFYNTNGISGHPSFEFQLL